MSDRIGRRVTLIVAVLAEIAGCLLLALGDVFAVFVIGQVCLGASTAFASGTDSALLYETLDREGRGADVDKHELRAWRFSFSGLAVSAVIGGALASQSAPWAYLATALAGVAALVIALRFRERAKQSALGTGVAEQLRALGAALTNRVLTWFFVLSVGMYVLSHVPFVFGQPFILEALEAGGSGFDAAIVSGIVSAAMMLISVAATWTAPPLQRALGVGAVCLVALAMQAGLIGALALSNHPWVIALLLLRMVPDALARAFILARIQPLLVNTHRATYLSLQSLCGRLVFAVTLIAFSFETSREAAMRYGEIQHILTAYAAGGLILLAGLAATIRMIRPR